MTDNEAKLQQIRKKFHENKSSLEARIKEIQESIQQICSEYESEAIALAYKVESPFFAHKYGFIKSECGKLFQCVNYIAHENVWLRLLSGKEDISESVILVEIASKPENHSEAFRNILEWHKKPFFEYWASSKAIVRADY